jgi:hypothetical protein
MRKYFGIKPGDESEKIVANLVTVTEGQWKRRGHPADFFDRGLSKTARSGSTPALGLRDAEMKRK